MKTKQGKPSHLAGVSGRTRNLRSADTASSNTLEIEFISDDGDDEAKHTETSNTSKKKRNAQKEKQQNSTTISKRARHVSASSPEKNLPSSPKSVAKSAKKPTMSSPAKNSRTKRNAAGSKRPYTPPPQSPSTKSAKGKTDDNANDKTTSSGKNSKSSSPSKPSKGALLKNVPKRARETKKPTSPTSTKPSSKTNAANATASPSKRAPQRGVKRRAASGPRARRPRKTRRSEAPLEVFATIRLECESASAPAHLQPLHPLYRKYPQLLRAPHVSLCDRERCLQQVSDLMHSTSCSHSLTFILCASRNTVSTTNQSPNKS